MSTSLSEQLKRLALPQTSLLQRDKKRPSLLFDPKEAAGLKRETVYQIGLDGLEELITKNPVFEQFKSNIFHITSKKFERAVQSADANKKLDKVIRKFLLQLSPYFLLNCAHKALEWLINRYNIHEFNRDDLLMLIMPYHESNIFVRVVQLMKFKDENDSWFFLKSIQKTGVHLTKQSLLNKASSDVYFLKFVAKFISLLVKQFEKPSLLTVAFNFYCTVFVGAIEYSSELNEAQITQMLPALLKGLNSDIPDFCAASYVILGRLVMKTPLTDAILDKFVEKVSVSKVETLKTESVLTLLILCQSQTHYTQLPESACYSLIGKNWLPKVLQDLSNGNCFVTPFLKVLVKTCLYGAVKLDLEEYRAFMKTLLAAIKFDDAFMEIFLSLLLDRTKTKKPYSEHLQKWLTEIIETLERQYPDQFDKEVYKILSTTQQGKVIKRRKSLQKILTETMNIRCKFDVLAKLYHPNVTYRKEAIKYLVNNYDSLRDREKEMIKSSFIDRLNDDSVEVVHETLNLIKNISVLKTDALKDVLTKLAYKCQSDLKTWGSVSTEIVLMLCEQSEANDWETFVAVLPYLLPNSENQLSAAQTIAESSFCRKNCLLKKINAKGEDCAQFCNSVFDSMRNNNKELVNDFIACIHKTTDRSVLSKYLIILILSIILPENSSIESNITIVKIFIEFIENCEIKYEKGNAFMQKHISVARAGQFHIEGFLLCLKNVIVKTLKPTVELGRVDLHEDTDFNQYFTLLATTLLKNKSNHKKYVHVFINYFCKTFRSKIEFLLNLVNSGKSQDLEFVTESVSLIAKLLSSVKDSNEMSSLLESDIFIPQLLALLLHKSEDVKQKSFRIVEILTEVKNDTFGHLFRELLDQREEIVVDNDQLPLIMFNYLSPSAVKDTKVSGNASTLKTLLIKTSCGKYPVYLKSKMLELLSHINTIEIFEETSHDCLHLLKTQSKNLDEVKSSIVVRNLQRCQPTIAGNIAVGTSIWTLIETCLKDSDFTLTVDSKPEFATVLLLKQFDREFFAQLDAKVETKLLDLIVETATLTKNPDVLPAVRHTIKVIELDAKLILSHFVKMRDVQSPKLDPNKLKRRISVVPTVDILDTLDWRKGLTALEFIQDKKKLTNIEVLFPVLFEILKKCLDFDEQAAVEYPKQLILLSILYLGEKIDRDSIGETTFNMELIVQCIRASQNPQTHYCALLVLAFSAELFPSQVLHHIMAIFTFMGSSVLRHEDAYSFQIITRIIDTVIPILVKDNNPETIARVLRVFVDALLDVPEHRRMPIYGHLLTKLQVKDNLYIFLLLIFESHVNHSHRDKNKEDDMKRLEIAASVCREFSPEIVIQNCINLMKYLKELPDEVDSDNTSSPFDIHYKTPKQFRHYKYTLIIFTARLLSSKEFVFQVASLKNDELLDLQQLYKDMIINILTYIYRISKIADKNANTQHAKYWKVILHLSYDILDSVNALLTPQMFLLVVKGLMLHNFSTIRRRSMELLNSKLQNNPSFFDDCTSEQIYSLIPPLISIIKNVEEAQSESDDELIVQTALLSLKLLTKFLVSDYHEKLAEILDFVTDLAKSGKVQNNVLASVLLCLAELCTNLRAHAIPSLPNFMPAILRILKQQKSQESSSLLLLSSVTTVQKIVETLPLFLSPYLEKLLYELSLLASNVAEEERLQPVVNKLSNLKQQIGTSIPPRVLIPVLGQSYDRLITKQAFSAVGFLLDTLAENLNHLNGSEIGANLPELTSFFLNALQFRTDQDTTFEQANEVEAQIVKALTKLILKLSESTFKPLYYKLFDWAARHEQKTERLITFYALSSGIAEALKSLFVLFAGHFLNNAAQILDSCNVTKTDALYFDDEKKNVLLLENVLKTLHSVFLYDSHKFVNKDRFEVLMQPLVDQLENTLGGVGGLERRNGELVTPVIVQFAVATADDSLWKQLNYQILLKMKHNSPEIRLISLNCLKEMVTKLGVDYLPLLPETIPVLAELLEDEEESVEKACRKAVQEMEKILGEPIEKYFKM
ncbi:HEAT repeat-containing protein 1 homolog [Tribolium castaneum]|uniref:HEAT repeat-containing protein 1 n=1 Tax=Tribolium castaneum TaxID=7070 RepID=D6WHT0_TRICA|nr:PREDICTED: HEAT repeat-containing protein 1 homolog [Tribolium castaneum]EFA00063.1 HEAT repeat-containing protein 1-like Protein [Tribolium castaneum]|eukprot:XP_967495.1 PREDICTED: HEAT repeat-containing protein 1 homolog [Tribolium castaneum]